MSDLLRGFRRFNIKQYSRFQTEETVPSEGTYGLHNLNETATLVVDQGIRKAVLLE